MQIGYAFESICVRKWLDRIFERMHLYIIAASVLQWSSRGSCILFDLATHAGPSTRAPYLWVKSTYMMLQHFFF